VEQQEARPVTAVALRAQAERPALAARAAAVARPGRLVAQAALVERQARLAGRQARLAAPQARPAAPLVRVARRALAAHRPLASQSAHEWSRGVGITPRTGASNRRFRGLPV
jgi:hypothetical protein